MGLFLASTSRPIAGSSPAQKAAALCEYFGVHEGGIFPPEAQAVFVGSPEIKSGSMLANEKPGHGSEVDEAAAARFPV